MFVVAWRFLAIHTSVIRLPAAAANLGRRGILNDDTMINGAYRHFQKAGNHRRPSPSYCFADELTIDDAVQYALAISLSSSSAKYTAEGFGSSMTL